MSEHVRFLTSSPQALLQGVGAWRADTLCWVNSLAVLITEYVCGTNLVLWVQYLGSLLHLCFVATNG